MRSGSSPHHKGACSRVVESVYNASNLRIVAGLAYSLNFFGRKLITFDLPGKPSFSLTGIFFFPGEERERENRSRSNLFDNFVDNGIHGITPKISTGN